MDLINYFEAEARVESLLCCFFFRHHPGSTIQTILLILIQVLITTLTSWQLYSDGGHILRFYVYYLHKRHCEILAIVERPVKAIIKMELKQQMK